MGMEACFSFCPRIAADLQEGADHHLHTMDFPVSTVDVSGLLGCCPGLPKCRIQENVQANINGSLG